MWKPISGFEGHYEISNEGRIKGLQRIVTHKNGRQFLIKEKVLNIIFSKKGYVRVNLALNATHNFFMVHQLVARAFIPNLENKPQINHKNGIKTDNRVENLEWCTNQENRDHAVKHNLHFTGARIDSTKKIESEIDKIRHLLKNGWTQAEIAKEYGSRQQTVSKILKRIGDPSIKEIVVVKP